VGVGELLTAHRALGAIDASSREDSRLAVASRAVLGPSPTWSDSTGRFDALFADARPSSEQPSLEELGMNRAGRPAQRGIPGARCRRRLPRRRTVAVPAAWSEVELLRHKDFAQYNRRRNGRRGAS